jgi:exopolysaccharide biosynthesis polyprenyl glycosylphosphotransferase
MSHKNFRQLLIAIASFFDVVAINSIFLAAYWLRFYSGLMDAIAVHKGPAPSLDGYFQLMPLMTIVYLVVIWWFGLYNFENRAKVDTFYAGIKATTFASILTLGAVFFYRGFSYSRWVMVISWVININVLFLNRMLIKIIERQLRMRGIGVNRMAVIGFNRTVQTLIDRIQSQPELGYEFIGIIAGQKPPMLIEMYRLLGETSDILNIVTKHHLDELFIASPVVSHQEILRLIHACEGKSVKFRIIPDLYEIMAGKVKVGEINGIPIIGLKELPLQGWRRLIKRLMDISISLAVLLILSPFMLIIAAVIKINDKGPVFFLQERVGQDGKPFTIYKFRSMRPDAEKGVGHRWAMKDDPRRTKVGAFLRQWSLDELPQLFNVLKGDMSLVGPRPEMSGLIQNFSKSIPHYLERHKVKSGMTGWAQINGLRGNTSLEERIKYDLYYIENWSLDFDIKILLKTIWSLKNY